MSDVSGIPNMGFGGGGYFANPFAATNNAVAYNQANMVPSMNANLAYVGGQNQAALNNAYGPQGFGGQTAQYAAAGAAYGRATGGYGGYGGQNDPLSSVGGASQAPLPGSGGGIPSGEVWRGQDLPDISKPWVNPVGSWEAGYGEHNPDVLAAARASGGDINAYLQNHLANYGMNEGRQVFDSTKYYQDNPDVKAAGMDAYQHYNQFGRNEGRAADWGNVFNPSTYLAANPDVAASGMNPLQHWLEFGIKEGREGGGFAEGTPYNDFGLPAYDAHNPASYAPAATAGRGMPEMLGTSSGGYDPQWGGTSIYPKGPQASPSDWNNWFGQFQGTTGGGPNDYTSGPGSWEREYLLGNPDVFSAAKASGADPIAFADQHFRDFGQNEGRGVFDAAEYLRENPDVAAAGVNPFQHYNQYGRSEGRAEPMSGAFDPMMYKLLNQDVADAGVDPTAHWLQYGKNEGRAGGFAPSNAALGKGANYDFSNPLVAQRADLANKIRDNPNLSLQYAARLNSEDQNNPETRQAIMEAMMNAYAATGRDPMNPKYYPSEATAKYGDALKRVSSDNNLLNSIYQEMERAFGGSNTSNYATDWASADTAADERKYTTNTYTSPSNEMFFRKDLYTPDPRTGEPWAGAGNVDKNLAWLQNLQNLSGPPR